MNADEQRLADLLKQVVPDPPRQLTYEEITVLNVERTVKSWLVPTLAAASVLIIGGAVGAVAATRSGHPAPSAPAAYQGTSRAGGSASPVPRPTSPGCPTPEPVPASGRGASLTVPNVTGQAQVSAVATLSRAGLKVVINSRASRAIPQGIAMLQSPAAGAHVAPGATVTLTISAGSGAAKPVASAVPTPSPSATCLPAGIAPGGPSPVPTGAVPTPSPSSGVPTAVPTVAAPTATSTPVAISAAPSAVPTQGKVSVPNLVGQSSLAATQTAQVAGLVVVVQSQSAPAAQHEPAGVVWGQEPAAGTAVPVGATITLYRQP